MKLAGGPTLFEEEMGLCSPKELQTKKVMVARIKLARKIIATKKVQHISSENLAKKAMVSKSTVSKIENCKPVTFDSVIKVLDALGIKCY